MTYYVRNISGNYAWVLKNELGPGALLNLDEVFKGFCQPKASSRAEADNPKFAEFKDGEFDEFLDWVKTEIIVDRGKFEIIDDVSLPAYEDDPAVTVKITKRRSMCKAAKPSGDIKVRGDIESLKEKRTTHKQVGKKLPSDKDLSPKEIAWLPYDGTSRKIIDGIDDVRRLKMAFRLVRNLGGQERTRKLIEDRLNDLSAAGK